MHGHKSKFNDGLPEILSPMDDIVFKMMFATRPDLLKSIIITVTGLPADEFDEIVVKDPHVYPEEGGEKYGILDIKLVIKSKKVIDVEMQKEKVANLRKRVVYYLSGMVVEQAAPGDSDYDLINRVISIVISGRTVIPGDSAYHHRYTLYDPETRSEFTDLLEVHVLETSKLPKADDGSELWGLMKFFIAKRKEYNMLAQKSPVLEKMVTRLEELSNDEEKRRFLRSIRIRELDEKYRREEELREAEARGIAKGEAKGIAKGEARGIAKGIAKGKAEGKAVGAVEMKTRVLDLLDKGYSADEIRAFLKENAPC